MERHIPNLLKNMVYLAFKTLLFSLDTKESNFFWLTLTIMISQMVRNECIRSGGRTDIEINYKILQLEILKKAPILLNLPCFQ
jgi:hypothetical protein